MQPPIFIAQITASSVWDVSRNGEVIARDLGTLREALAHARSLPGSAGAILQIVNQHGEVLAERRL